LPWRRRRRAWGCGRNGCWWRRRHHRTRRRPRHSELCSLAVAVATRRGRWRRTRRGHAELRLLGRFARSCRSAGNRCGRTWRRSRWRGSGWRARWLCTGRRLRCRCLRRLPSGRLSSLRALCGSDRLDQGEIRVSLDAAGAVHRFHQRAVCSREVWLTHDAENELTLHGSRVQLAGEMRFECLAEFLHGPVERDARPLTGASPGTGRR